MPKPVLSDSLFNADDVATAVLAEANLQIANSNLGVSDISSSVTLQSGWTVSHLKFLYFNGFVFWGGFFTHGGGTPANNEAIATIDDANYRPTEIWRCQAIGFQTDSGSNVRILTNGRIEIEDPVNTGHTNFYVQINNFYHINY